MSFDDVNHPQHYVSLGASCKKCLTEIECIDVVRHFGFNLGNVIKYLWRKDHKGAPLKDLRKALFYLQDEIKRLENDAT